MMQIKTLIFDLDGTLIDSAPGILACFSHLMKERGIAPKLPLDNRLIGPPLRETLQRLIGSSDPTLTDELADAFKARYDATVCEITVPYAGIDAVLDALHAQGITIHIATNKRITATRLLVEHLGWSQLFTSIYARDSFSPALNSKGELIGRVLDEQKIDRRHAAYVGDTPEDGYAAQENTMKFLAAHWGYGEFYAQHDAPRIPADTAHLTHPADVLRQLTGNA